MGIKNLNYFLNKYAVDSIKIYTSYKSLIDQREKNIVIAIDMNLYYYKFIKSNLNNPYHGFLLQINRMLEYGVTPIYIMDGKSPKEKEHLVNKRKRSDRNEFIDYDTLKAFFDILNVSYFHSNIETDQYVGHLYKNNIIQYCLTDDFDILLYGCSRFISIQKRRLILYDKYTILKQIGLSEDMFLYFCIFLGCDYNKKIYNISCDDLYTTFQACEDVDAVIKVLNETCEAFYPRYNIEDIVKNTFSIYKNRCIEAYFPVIKERKLLDMKTIIHAIYVLKKEMIGKIPFKEFMNFVRMNNN